jgi:hypothetical protein
MVTTHLHIRSADGKNAWKYTSTPLYVFMAWFLNWLTFSSSPCYHPLRYLRLYCAVGKSSLNKPRHNHSYRMHLQQETSRSRRQTERALSELEGVSSQKAVCTLRSHRRENLRSSLHKCLLQRLLTRLCEQYQYLMLNET